MRAFITVDLVKISGKRQEPDEVREMLGEEIPDEVWVDDTAYQITVVSVEGQEA
jgi:hypothetical protein